MRKTNVWLKSFLTAIILAFVLNSGAQNTGNETLLTIDGQKISSGEFLNVYQKNNIQTDVIDRKSMEEYLELFINFKLKVRDAERHGLDTVKTLMDELAGYRKQLSAPYFVDEEVTNTLVNEAYKRMQYDLRASHILIRCDQNAPPQDTLAAWNKISLVLQKANEGIPFEQLAAEYSEDPSARDREATSQHPFIKGNKGDLGFFTAFNMVYPFETAAYNTPVGKISPIVRTNFGYHLIRISNKRPALGRAQVAHVFFQIPPKATPADSATVKHRADSAYARFLAGEDFNAIVKAFSDDKGSATRDGVLPWFTCNRLVPEFIEVVYALEPGKVSEPILTSYGYHIIKMIEHKPVGSFDELSNEIRQKVEKDMRYNLSRESIIHKIKKDYGYKSFPNALAEFNKMVDDSIFVGKWIPLPDKKLKKPLFSIGKKTVAQSEFARFLAKDQRKQKSQPIDVYVGQKYMAFEEQVLFEFEDQQLETKYPEFGMIMKEYRDGILLFELTQQKVWDKAVKDTTGLQAFYETIKNNYMWPERKEATVVTIKNLDNEKAAAALSAKVSEWVNYADMTLETIRTKIMEDSALIVHTERTRFVAGEKTSVDALSSPTQTTDTKTKDDNGKYTLELVVLNRLLPPMPKELNEVRGHITADYQNHLEKEWIKELRGKYKVEVNQSVLQQLLP
jgi:peptidyl-prolyl cis-trans isomerase SurA